MKRVTKSEWVEHKILDQMAISQWVGMELGEFNCQITFNARHTLKLETGLVLLESYVKQGLNFPLIIGSQLVGGFQYPNYVMTECEADYGITDNRGYGLHSTVRVKFKQYRTSTSSSSGGLFGNIGGVMGSALSSLSSAAGAITGLSSAVTGVVSNTIGSTSTIAGAVVSIPGVSQAVSGAVNSIGAITSAAGVSGVVGAVNSIMTSGGSVVNGITGGSIPSSLSGITKILPSTGVNVSNAISLANGGGIQTPST